MKFAFDHVDLAKRHYDTSCMRTKILTTGVTEDTGELPPMTKELARSFPLERHHGYNPEKKSEHEKHSNRDEGRGQAQTTPGHAIKAIHCPTRRNHHRDFLHPLREKHRGHPGSAEHHHDQGRHYCVATSGLNRLAERGDHEAEGGSHQGESCTHSKKPEKTPP